jgi:predicted NAD-dependent protein-ADP-ribosyltransferase YbiA (DUF1768 family)
MSADANLVRVDPAVLEHPFVKSPATAAARSVDELRAACVAGARPRFVFFWGHRPRREGVVDQSSFSQWFPATFRVDGHEFGSAEQYMMWRKARLFEDDASAAAVLNARSAAHAKAIGREVQGFDDDVWKQHRWEIVVSASVAKFSANQALGSY